MTGESVRGEYGLTVKVMCVLCEDNEINTIKPAFAVKGV